MNLLRNLWHDECGAVLSAEMVTVGTLSVVGAGAGLGAVGHSVNEEMKEAAYAIRSLDQSFYIAPQVSCSAWTAGSCYIQPPVEESRAELRARIDELERQQRDETQPESQKDDPNPDAVPRPDAEPTPRDDLAV